METTIFLVIECVQDGFGILTIRDSFILKRDAQKYIDERPSLNLVIQEISLLW